MSVLKPAISDHYRDCPRRACDFATVKSPGSFWHRPSQRFDDSSECLSNCCYSACLQTACLILLVSSLDFVSTSWSTGGIMQHPSCDAVQGNRTSNFDCTSLLTASNFDWASINLSCLRCGRRQAVCFQRKISPTDDD